MIDWKKIIGELEDLREGIIFKTSNPEEQQIYETIEYLHYLMDEQIRNGEKTHGA